MVEYIFVILAIVAIPIGMGLWLGLSFLITHLFLKRYG